MIISAHSAMPPDVIDPPSQQIVAGATPRRMGECVLVPNYAGAEVNLLNSLSPEASAKNYLHMFEKERVGEGKALVTLVARPLHGRIEFRAGGLMYYVPDKGFRGFDRVSASADLGGYHVAIDYHIQVLGDDVGNDSFERLCKRGLFYKVNGKSIDAPLPESMLKVALSGFLKVSFSFENLSGARIGEPFGSGAGASVALSESVAGHGWFIDSTSLDHGEFLPTADPNVWVARESSESAGGVDLL